MRGWLRVEPGFGVVLGPLGARLAENVPTDPISVPLLIGQGALPTAPISTC